MKMEIRNFDENIPSLERFGITETGLNELRAMFDRSIEVKIRVKKDGSAYYISRKKKYIFPDERIAIIDLYNYLLSCFGYEFSDGVVRPMDWKYWRRNGEALRKGAKLKVVHWYRMKTWELKSGEIIEFDSAWDFYGDTHFEVISADGRHHQDSAYKFHLA